MKLKLTARETADIIRRRNSKGRKRLVGPKLEARKREPVDDGGSAYMAWLHVDIPCLACLVVGKGSRQRYAGRIEAAHQKLQVADRGWHRRAGRRGPHWTCVPLCAGHHRIGPLCCDPAQTKFWSIIGLAVEQVVDFAEELNEAFRKDASGAAVVRRYASIAAAQRVLT